MADEHPHPPPRDGWPALPVRGLDLLWILVLTVGVLLVLRVFVFEPEPTTAFILMMLALQFAVPLAAVYLIIVRGRGVSWRDIGFRPAARSWYLIAIIIAALSVPLVALVNFLVQAWTGEPFENPQVQVIATAGVSWVAMIGMLIMTGVVAPIVEEIVFRGILYRWLRQHAGVTVGVILSALAFSVLHRIPMLIPAILLQGVILAVLYEKSRSLWPPIIMHGGFNIMMTVALYLAIAGGFAVE